MARAFGWPEMPVAKSLLRLLQRCSAGDVPIGREPSGQRKPGRAGRQQDTIFRLAGKPTAEQNDERR